MLVEEGTEREKANIKISMRSQLYSFFAAIREEVRKWEEKEEEYSIWVDGMSRAKVSGKSVLKPMRPWAADFVEFAKQTSVRLEENGVRLVPKTQTCVAELLGRSVNMELLAQGRVSKEEEEMKEQPRASPT